MARKAYFRKKDRFGQESNPGKILLPLVIAMAIALLLLVVAQFNNQPAVPAMAVSTEHQAKAEPFFLRGSSGAQIFLQVIPGLEQADLQTVDATGNSDETKGSRLSALADRFLPEKIVADQIPYMGYAESLVQPISNTPTEDQSLNSVEQPRIVIPARKPLAGGKIILYHTHTTESFKPTTGNNFTEDLSQTVVRVGEELAKVLEDEYGITVIHDKTIHDLPRATAYQEALPTLTNLLEKHPDADLVIDLHRDGVLRSASTVRINGEATGNILFVIGKRNNPYWQETVNTSRFLHERLNMMHAGISRGLLENPLNYNQHLHPNSLLIEVGGNNNSLEEALRTVPYLADAIADLYKADL